MVRFLTDPRPTHVSPAIIIATASLLLVACTGSDDSPTRGSTTTMPDMSPASTGTDLPNERPDKTPSEMPAESGTSELADGTTWHLLAYRTTQGDEIVLLPVDGAAGPSGTMQTLTFSAAGTDADGDSGSIDGGTLTTTGYCAIATADYTFEASNLTTSGFEDVGEQTFGCISPTYNGDAIGLASFVLQDAFDDGTTWLVSTREGRLELDAEDGRRLVLGPRPPGDAAPLFPFADTTWTLETTRTEASDGRYPNLAPPPIVPALKLRFAPDVSALEGTVEIAYGCRRFEIEWALEGGILNGMGMSAIEIEPAMSPGCAAATDTRLDSTFLPGLLDTVLSGMSSVTIAGDTLYLSGETGTTLVLTGSGPGPGEQSIAVETLFRGDRAQGENAPSFDDARRLVVYRDQDTLNAAFASLETEMGADLGQSPQVDFAKNVVVGAFLAIDGDTSDDIAPRTATVGPDGLEVVFAIREEIPGELAGDCVADGAISGPFVFVRVESRVAPVRLVERVTSFCTGLPALS